MADSLQADVRIRETGSLFFCACLDMLSSPYDTAHIPNLGSLEGFARIYGGDSLCFDALFYETARSPRLLGLHWLTRFPSMLSLRDWLVPLLCSTRVLWLAQSFCSHLGPRLPRRLVLRYRPVRDVDHAYVPEVLNHVGLRRLLS